MIIYLDMDGVVADFNAYAESVLRHPAQDERFPESDWRHLRDNPRLYRDLPLIAESLDLVNVARRCRDLLGYELMFLTAVPRNNDVHWAFWDKFLWAQKYFPDIPVHFGPYSQDKHQHCQPGDILIDDRTSNIEQWRQAGGQAVKVRAGELAPAILFLEGLLTKESHR